MKLSELVGKPITLRQKNFLAKDPKHPYHDVQATMIEVRERSVKCQIRSGTIYIPIQYFDKKRSDLLNRIIHLPNWFSYQTREELDAAMIRARVHTANSCKP